jgi:hypothetical protein
MDLFLKLEIVRRKTKKMGGVEIPHFLSSFEIRNCWSNVNKKITHEEKT